jgi:hypothetical protein
MGEERRAMAMSTADDLYQLAKSLPVTERLRALLPPGGRYRQDIERFFDERRIIGVLARAILASGVEQGILDILLDTRKKLIHEAVRRPSQRACECEP